MKLFQQLLVIPAAFGLVAPFSVDATEVNISDVSRYASKSGNSSKAPFASGLSSIRTGDWTYDALKSLGNSYECVDNIYNQNLNSNVSLTREEAAKLVNACLDKGLLADADDLPSDASRSEDQLNIELAILKGRIDGLEYKLQELHASTFSSTTKLKGQANFVIGSAIWENGSTESEALHSIYSYELDLDTSFTGKDLLHAGLEAGNYSATSPLLLETNSSVGDSLTVGSLYYSFPVGEFTVAAGPLLDLTEISTTTSSTYSNSFFFGGFYLGPNAFAQAKGINGPGAGFSYAADNGINFSGSYIAINGSDAELGIGTEEGIDAVSFTVGYDSTHIGGGISYTSLEDPDGAISELVFSLTGLTFDEDPHAFGIGVYWSPNQSFDISAGVDLLDIGISGYEEGTTFSVGADLDLAGGVLSAGVASIPDWDSNNHYDQAGLAYEAYYDFPVSDFISIKPGLMVADIDDDNGDSSVRYAIETTFKF